MRVSIVTGPNNYVDLIAEDLADAGELVCVSSSKFAKEHPESFCLMPTNVQPRGVSLRIYLLTDGT